MRQPNRIAGWSLRPRNTWNGKQFHSVFCKGIPTSGIGQEIRLPFQLHDLRRRWIPNLWFVTIVKEMRLEWIKSTKQDAVLSRISVRKNRWSPWQAYQNDPLVKADDEQRWSEKWVISPEIHRLFQSRKAMISMIFALTYWTCSSEIILNVLNKYQQRFAYVMVDEVSGTPTFPNTLIHQKASSRPTAEISVWLAMMPEVSMLSARRNIQNILNYWKGISWTYLW